MPAAVSIRKVDSSTTCAASVWSRNTDDIGNIVVGANKGVPVRVRDIGEVTIGHAPRLGQFGFQNNDDAVEGVILMLRGEQTQNVLKGVQAKTEELNRQILPPDVKIHPFYDRSELVDLTTETVEANLLRGMVLVLLVLIFFWSASGPQLSSRSPFRYHFCLPSSSCMPTMSPQICCRSEPSTSAL